MADAEHIEETFRAKLATFAPSITDAPDTAKKMEQPPPPHGSNPNEPEKRRRSKVINKSVLALSEPRRIRDRDPAKHVAKPCLVCGRSLRMQTISDIAKPGAGA